MGRTGRLCLASAHKHQPTTAAEGAAGALVPRARERRQLNLRHPQPKINCRGNLETLKDPQQRVAPTSHDTTDELRQKTIQAGVLICVPAGAHPLIAGRVV